MAVRGSVVKQHSRIGCINLSKINYSAMNYDEFFHPPVTDIWPLVRFTGIAAGHRGGGYRISFLRSTFPDHSKIKFYEKGFQNHFGYVHAIFNISTIRSKYGDGPERGDQYPQSHGRGFGSESA